MKVTDMLAFMTGIIAILGFVYFIIGLFTGKINDKIMQKQYLYVHLISIFILIGALLVSFIGILLYSTNIPLKLELYTKKDTILLASIFCEALPIWDIYLVGRMYSNLLRQKNKNLHVLKNLGNWKWGAIVTILIQLSLINYYKSIYAFLLETIRL